MKLLKEEKLDRKQIAIEELAKKLELDPKTLKAEEERSDNMYIYYTVETEDGERYVVADYDTAEDLAKSDVKSVVDDLGIESFTKEYQKKIFDKFADEEPFHQAFDESYRSYIEDIKSEDDDEYENRFVRELVENEIVSDDDLVKNEDGLLALKEDADEDDLVDRFVDAMANAWNYDYVNWMKTEFGLDEVTRFIKENDAIDWDDVAKDAVDTDGIAHFVASYDGKDIELGADLHAYRID